MLPEEKWGKMVKNGDVLRITMSFSDLSGDLAVPDHWQPRRSGEASCGGIS
jgi:hypothetical protein